MRQGKGLVVSDFPRDVRQAEQYEAKVQVSEELCHRSSFDFEMCSICRTDSMKNNLISVGKVSENDT